MYLLVQIDHSRAAGFQAHVHRRDNIGRKRGFPVREHSDRPIVQYLSLSLSLSLSFSNGRMVERGVSCLGAFWPADCTISGTIFLLPPLSQRHFVSKVIFRDLDNLLSSFYLPPFAMTVPLCFRSDRPKTGTGALFSFLRAELCFINLLQLCKGISIL